MANIVGVSRLQTARPKRHWAYVMIAAVILLLAGLRFSQYWLGWVIAFAGALLGLWGWFFHRQRVWIVRVNLLLGQRITLQFDELEDAAGFMTALQDAKGGSVSPTRPA